MPASVVAAARENLSDREKQLAEHLARGRRPAAARAGAAGGGARERAALADTETDAPVARGLGPRARGHVSPAPRRQARRSAARSPARDRHDHRGAEGARRPSCRSRRRGEPRRRSAPARRLRPRRCARGHRTCRRPAQGPARSGRWLRRRARLARTDRAGRGSPSARSGSRAS